MVQEIFKPLKDEDLAIKNFQKIRLKIIKNFLIIIAIFAVFFAYFKFKDNPTEGGILGATLFILMFILMIRWVFMVAFNYKCPKCGTIPMSGMGALGADTSASVGSMIALNPKECRKCGQRLR